jgi:hypothetical protein
MDAAKIAKTQAHMRKMYGEVRAWVAGSSLTVRIMLGLFLFAALLMALHTALTPKDANLRINVQHGFRSADISVWVDGDLAYSGKLTGSARKKFGLIAGSIQGSLSEIVPVSSGNHQIRVQVQPDSGSAQQDSLTAEFPANTERKLSISSRPGSLSLAWQGSTTTAPVSGSNSWFMHYAGALALTVGGSIVSALTGFALRELPGHIRSRHNVEVAEVKVQSTAAGS